MKIKTLIVSIAVGVAAFALAGIAGAQIQIVSSTYGEGTLKNREGAEAGFAFRVRKLNEDPAEGRLRFSTHIPGGQIAIGAEELRRLNVRHNEAWFGGHAVFEFTNLSGESHRYEGVVLVHVRDNVVVEENHIRRIVDLMEIHFDFDNSDRVFNFSGWADRASIVVEKHRA